MKKKWVNMFDESLCIIALYNSEGPEACAVLSRKVCRYYVADEILLPENVNAPKEMLKSLPYKYLRLT